MKTILIASLILTFIGGLVFESFRKKNKYRGRIILIFGGITSLILISNIIYKDYLKSKVVIEGIFQVYLDNSPVRENENNMYYAFNKNGIVLMGFSSSTSNFIQYLKDGIKKEYILTGSYSSIWKNTQNKNIRVKLDNSEKYVCYSYDSLNNELSSKKMVLKFKEELNQIHSISIKDNDTSKFCSLTKEETFNYLIANSPFKLGNEGEVNFTKRFDFNHNQWVEGSINISGSLNYNNRLSGKYEVIKGNLIQLDELKAIGGNYDASNNSYSFGSFKINCSGDIEGYLKDYKGNSKDILIKK
ncbi:hypothetical protein PL373_11525 [Tenacibaculum maritimum]|nr:hypothetical protein [Tenacibaculum maritimum]MDB0601767.1 hypothetical protein [Tenacibaculum maritimum]MDB0610863.1 hypothetical protein [Tenacibaculum maritimum]